MKPYEIMECWAAGDWDDDPDGGTCTAIMKAYLSGIEAAEIAARKVKEGCVDVGERVGAEWAAQAIHALREELQ